MNTNKVQDFYFYKEQNEINMVTVPYRGIDPIEHLVIKRIQEKGRVLYITGEKKEESLIYKRLKVLGIDSIYDTEDFEFGINIINFDEGLKIVENYDLLIYDDVNSFPEHTKLEIQNLVGYLHGKCKKIVAYSIEPIFNGIEVIEIPLKGRSGFITEPRVIETRLDIKACFPNSIYEYIVWFRTENRKALFITQDEKSKNNIKEFLIDIDEDYKYNIIDIDDMDISEIKKYAYKEDRPYIFISSTIRELLDVGINFEIIVAGADSDKFDYRKLLFLTLRTGYIDNTNGELVLLCKTVNTNIKKTQDTARYYNKVIWDAEFVQD